MAFQNRNLACNMHSLGYTEWVYRPEADDDVEAPGFFNSIYAMAAVGDLILVIGRPTKIYCVMELKIDRIVEVKKIA